MIKNVKHKSWEKFGHKILNQLSKKRKFNFKGAKMEKTLWSKKYKRQNILTDENDIHIMQRWKQYFKE